MCGTAIWKLKEEVVELKRRGVEAVVLEEFMPLKRNSSDHEDGRAKKLADWTDKKNWMSSAQLWTTPIKYENGFSNVQNQDSIFLHQSVSLCPIVLFFEHLCGFDNSFLFMTEESRKG